MGDVVAFVNLLQHVEWDDDTVVTLARPAPRPDTCHSMPNGNIPESYALTIRKTPTDPHPRTGV